MITFNLNQFLKKFEEDAQARLDMCSKIINSTIRELFKRIIYRTPKGNPNLWHPPYWPKGYQPGTLKAAWRLSFNGREGEGEGSISFKLKDNTIKVVSIYNNEPYAKRVEDGWSTQAPTGMLRVSINEYKSLIEQYAREFKK